VCGILQTVSCVLKHLIFEKNDFSYVLHSSSKIFKMFKILAEPSRQNVCTYFLFATTVTFATYYHCICFTISAHANPKKIKIEKNQLEYGNHAIVRLLSQVYCACILNISTCTMQFHLFAMQHCLHNFSLCV